MLCARATVGEGSRSRHRRGVQNGTSFEESHRQHLSATMRATCASTLPSQMSKVTKHLLRSIINEINVRKSEQFFMQEIILWNLGGFYFHFEVCH